MRGTGKKCGGGLSLEGTLPKSLVALKYFPAFLRSRNTSTSPKFPDTAHAPKCAYPPLHEGNVRGRTKGEEAVQGERAISGTNPKEMTVAQIRGRPRQMCCLEPLLLFFPSRSATFTNRNQNLARRRQQNNNNKQQHKHQHHQCQHQTLLAC